MKWSERDRRWREEEHENEITVCLNRQTKLVFAVEFQVRKESMLKSNIIQKTIYIHSLIW